VHGSSDSQSDSGRVALVAGAFELMFSGHVLTLRSQSRNNHACTA
jgi:hypothetical protein